MLREKNAYKIRTSEYLGPIWIGALLLSGFGITLVLTGLKGLGFQI